MESPSKFAASPGTPLFPLSPERVNGRLPYSNSTIPQSPSMPEFGKPSLSLKPSLLGGSPEAHFRHSRNNSVDAHVQGMVARFDGLTIRDVKASSEVAIKRADMAREMAEMERDKARRDLRELEGELRKMREDNRKIKKEVDDGKERERKVSKRLEVVIEEFQRAKETHSHAVNVYEKEIRKSRKEAFKSGSSLVKLQEELKATRNSLRITQSGLESEKLKSARREQEAFTAQYHLIGVQEELQKAQEKIQVVETERDSLKTSLQEEEVARMAAEGKLALPNMEEGDDEDLFASPRKSPQKRRVDSNSEDKENIVPKRAIDLQNLHGELAIERRLRERAQEQIEFMKMECQFQICSCRLAEGGGHDYVHDKTFASEMEKIRELVPLIKVPMSSDNEDLRMGNDPLEGEGRIKETETEQVMLDTANKHEHSSFYTAFEAAEIELPPCDLESSHTEALASEEVLEEMDTAEVSRPSTPEVAAVEEPQTPVHREIRTITTTVPITFSPFPIGGHDQLPTTPMTVGHPPFAHQPGSPFPNSAFNADGTLDREAALAKIRERRGRARSVAIGQATPRKQMLEGVNGRRDISAPALKSYNTS